MPKQITVLDYYDDLIKDFPEYREELHNWLAEEEVRNDTYIRMWVSGGFGNSDFRNDMLDKIWKKYDIYPDQYVVVWVSW